MTDGIKVRAAAAAADYKQHRGVGNRKDYNTGYNSALEDVGLILQTRIQGLQAAYNQSPVLPALEAEAGVIKTRIESLRQDVICERCGKAIKWLNCAESECNRSVRKEG